MTIRASSNLGSDARGRRFVRVGPSVKMGAECGGLIAGYNVLCRFDGSGVANGGAARTWDEKRGRVGSKKVVIK